MATNPYQSPLAVGPPQVQFTDTQGHQQGIVFLLFAMFCGGVLLALAQTASVGLRNWVAPRFGGLGLYNGAFPMVFLVAWLRVPHVAQIRAAAWVCVAIGGVHAVGLLWKGTVAAVAYPQLERLHSSWWYAVAPFLLAAILLAWVGSRSARAVPSHSS